MKTTDVLKTLAIAPIVLMGASEGSCGSDGKAVSCQIHAEGGFQYGYEGYALVSSSCMNLDDDEATLSATPQLVRHEGADLLWSAQIKELDVYTVDPNPLKRHTQSVLDARNGRDLDPLYLVRVKNSGDPVDLFVEAIPVEKFRGSAFATLDSSGQANEISLAITDLGDGKISVDPDGAASTSRVWFIPGSSTEHPTDDSGALVMGTSDFEFTPGLVRSKGEPQIYGAFVPTTDGLVLGPGSVGYFRCDDGFGQSATAAQQAAVASSCVQVTAEEAETPIALPTNYSLVIESSATGTIVPGSMVSFTVRDTAGNDLSAFDWHWYQVWPGSSTRELLQVTGAAGPSISISCSQDFQLIAEAVTPEKPLGTGIEAALDVDVEDVVVTNKTFTVSLVGYGHVTIKNGAGAIVEDLVGVRSDFGGGGAGTEFANFRGQITLEAHDDNQGTFGAWFCSDMSDAFMNNVDLFDPVLVISEGVVPDADATSGVPNCVAQFECGQYPQLDNDALFIEEPSGARLLWQTDTRDTDDGFGGSVALPFLAVPDGYPGEDIVFVTYIFNESIEVLFNGAYLRRGDYRANISAREYDFNVSPDRIEFRDASSHPNADNRPQGDGWYAVSNTYSVSRGFDGGGLGIINGVGVQAWMCGNSEVRDVWHGTGE